MKKIFFVASFSLSVGNLLAQQHNTDSLPKGWWYFPKTDIKFKFGGYVKADVIHDFNPIDSRDFFDVTKIPTDSSEGQTTHFNVKETRLLLDVRAPARKGEIRTYLETDFYGTSGAFRIRHAYVDIFDRWLIGQTWSNFMDESIIPNTLDFEKPGAYAFARHGMVRWKQKFSPKMYLALAIEEPSANAVAPAPSGKFYSPLPDFTARFRYTAKWGHVQLSAFTGVVQYRYTAGGKDNVGLYGINLSGQVNFGKKDYFIYQAVGGAGVGRMHGGLSVAPDANNSLKPIDGIGFTGGICHYWTPVLSSLFVYNSGGVRNTDGQSESSLNWTDYLAANLLWQFMPSTMAGVEYLWGKRVDKSDASGVANRIQFSVKYSFNM